MVKEVVTVEEASLLGKRYCRCDFEVHHCSSDVFSKTSVER